MGVWGWDWETVTYLHAGGSALGPLCLMAAAQIPALTANCWHFLGFAKLSHLFPIPPPFLRACLDFGKERSRNLTLCFKQIWGVVVGELERQPHFLLLFFFADGKW